MAPFGIIYIFNWVIFIIIFVSLLRKSKAKSENKTNEKSFRKKLRQQFIIALTLSLLFGLGWGVGMIATTSIPEIGVSLTLQAIFIVLTSFQGLLVFIMHCMRSTDARNEWARWINIVTCHRITLGQQKLGRDLSYRPRSGTASTAVSSGGDTLKRAVKKDLEKTLSSKSFLSSQLEPVEEKRDLSLQQEEKTKCELKPDAEDGGLQNGSKSAQEYDLNELILTVKLGKDSSPNSPTSTPSPPPVGETIDDASFPPRINFTLNLDLDNGAVFFANEDSSIHAKP